MKKKSCENCLFVQLNAHESPCKDCIRNVYNKKMKDYWVEDND